MNTTLREVFARRANDAGTVDLDIEELVALGEHRLRRRRLTAVLASAAAVVVAIALALGGTLIGPVKHGQGPVDNPVDHVPTTPVRKIVYGDGHRSRTIHWGDRVVETGNGWVHLDVTDDGFIYTRDGRAWFSDGGTPERIGSHLCAALPNGEFVHAATGAVMSANTGSLAAWFDCTQVTRPTLVVYDTASRREVARQPIAFCADSRTAPALPLENCELVDVTAQYVYFNRGIYSGHPNPEYRFEVTTHQLHGSTPQEYAEDLISHPRGLVVGDTQQSGTPTDGVRNEFRVVGSRLVPWWRLPNGEQVLTKAFDTATGHEIRLRLPSGYDAEPEYFSLFEWLDDNTVALFGGYGGYDILTCQLSDGRCDLTVQGLPGEHDVAPVVPEHWLPG